jgi:hypothetical protein
VSIKGVVLSFTVTAVTIFGMGGKHASSDQENEKVVIAKVVRDSIRWALTKDRALQESTMAQDEDLFYFWTHSDFTIRGWSQHVKLFDLWMGPRFKATLTEVRNLRVTLSRSGDVAWYSAILDDLGELDGKPVGARDIRWTGVLEKRDGKWVIVQMHASLAADKVLDQASRETGDAVVGDQ